MTKRNECGRIRCFITQKTIDKKERMVDIEGQLNKCNECVSSTTDDVKNKTRNIVARKYVSEYWKRVHNT